MHMPLCLVTVAVWLNQDILKLENWVQQLAVHLLS